MTALRTSTVTSLADIDATAWDALAAGENFPFARHAFLRLLETSRSVGRGTGWTPAYVVAHAGRDLVGALPSYVKTDSYGEYVFDWAWAQAAARAGLRYYPKIVVAIPFTAANGPRFFVRPDADAEAVRTALLEGLRALMHDAGAESAHVLLCSGDDAAFLSRAGFIHRHTHQFHFHNRGYRHYDDFLAALRSESRKQLRKERRRVAEQGLTVVRRAGADISADDWREIFALYMHTAGRKWGRPYLTEAFFRDAPRVLGDAPLVAFALRDQRIVAMSLSFTGRDAIYGRYWGATEEHDSLHFELCYHQLIDEAIARGVSLVEAGAQGEHKHKRGFLPEVTHSAHLFTVPALGDAIARNVAAENAALAQAFAEAAEHSPFRSV